jgi:hypothetical protein
MTIKQKKENLINFIKWKMSHSGETEKEQEAILKYCRKLSYKALHEYAVRNDFIDY